MDTKLSAQLAALMSRIDSLAQSRDEAARRLQAAHNEIVSLKDEIIDLKSQLQKRDLDVAYLSLSHKMADNPQALADAREIIKGLINKVNRAISLLENDPAL